MGLDLTPVAVGCCGMAGTFGHEASHLDESTGIYQLSWQQAIAKFAPQQILASGYSCRSQVARFEGFKPKHPLQALLTHLMLGRDDQPLDEGQCEQRKKQ
jgi:Fe-S oxidoreductase